MATTEAISAIAKRVQNNINMILKQDIETLERQELRGQSLDFGSSRLELKAIVFIAESLQQIDDFLMVPANTLGSLATQLEGIVKVFERIRAFPTANENNPGANKKDLEETLRTVHKGLYSSFSTVAAVAGRALIDAGPAREEIKATIEFMKRMSTESAAARNEIVGYVESAKALLETTKKVVTVKAISDHSDLFEKQAEEHKTAAQIWLGITATIAGGIAGLAWWLFKTAPTFADTENVGEPLFLLGGKVFLFSVLMTTLVMASKTYRANRHNYVVNKHRQNALSTFLTFAKASEPDQEMKRMILLQSTQCIFSPQATGFTGGKESDSQNLQILEIFKGFKS